MRRKIAALTAGVAIIASGISTPAMAMTIEHFEDGCQFTPTPEEITLLELWGPIGYKHDEIDGIRAAIKPALDEYSHDYVPSPQGDEAWVVTDPELRAAKYAAFKAFDDALVECKAGAVTEEEEVEAPVEEETPVAPIGGLSSFGGSSQGGFFF
ncbi:hypothetical protein QP027_07155 [Corynebacterium breve]|uniref:Uncharacterized protein n=1 Tax=Corynebacterium breve TaxID=3049799 RepID=A0ABY8VB68_9CORY|nr:hypothetical protein [Corynebacterium breve]WIM66911.1 hypothetical protein QP027_07155 [Corynebacterium breve]